MRRMVAVFSVGIGLALVGVALGLLYMDFRRERALAIAFMADIPQAVQDSAPRHQPNAGDETAMKVQAIQKWVDPMPIWIALFSGSIGAALFGSGCLLALFETAIFQPRREIR